MRLRTVFERAVFALATYLLPLVSFCDFILLNTAVFCGSRHPHLAGVWEGGIVVWFYLKWALVVALSF